MPGRKESFTRLCDSTKHSVVGLPFEYPTVVVPGSRQGRPKKDDVRPKVVDVGHQLGHPVRAISTVHPRPSLSYKGWEGPSSRVTPTHTLIAAISNPSEIVISPL